MDTSRHGEKGDAKINESDSVDIVDTHAMGNEDLKPQSLWATVFSCSALISSKSLHPNKHSLVVE